VAANSDASPGPDAFRRAVADLSSAVWRPELQVEEIPSPQRIAPFSAAITADVVVGGEDIGSGRLVLLHDPAGNAAWQGTFRCVTFARADVAPEMVTDPLLASVGWSWLIDALESRGAAYGAPSGTVTSVASESFGGMADEAPRAEVEVRASWTALLNDGIGLIPHLSAWAELLCMTAGLPPLPAGFTTVNERTSCGSGSCYRERRVVEPLGMTRPQVLAALDRPTEVCRANTLFDRRRLCTGVTIRGDGVWVYAAMKPLL